MPVSTATIATLDPARVIRRLCKHWQHKFVVRFDEEQGEILLGESRCVMLVKDGALQVALHTPDVAQQQRLEGVVADHIRRMASSETLDIEWNPAESLDTL